MRDAVGALYAPRKKSAIHRRGTELYWVTWAASNTTLPDGAHSWPSNSPTFSAMPLSAVSPRLFFLCAIV